MSSYSFDALNLTGPGQVHNPDQSGSYYPSPFSNSSNATTRNYDWARHNESPEESKDDVFGPSNHEHDGEENGEEDDDEDGAFVPENEEVENGMKAKFQGRTKGTGKKIKAAPYDRTYRGLIRDAAQFYAEHNKRVDDLRAAACQTSQVCDRAPTDPAEVRRCIGLLYDAILNLFGIIDKRTSSDGLSQAASRIESGYYPAKDIELECWRLWFAVCDAQLGISNVAPHHKSKYEDKTVHESFMDRFAAVLDTLKTSKASAKMLLDPPFYCRLADAPNKQKINTIDNMKINGMRNVQNRLGRQAIQDMAENDRLTIADFVPIAANTPKKNKSGTTKAPSSTKRKSIANADKASPAKRPSRSKVIDKYDESEAEEEFYETPARRSTGGKRLPATSSASRSPKQEDSGSSSGGLGFRGSSPAPPPRFILPTTGAHAVSPSAYAPPALGSLSNDAPVVATSPQTFIHPSASARAVSPWALKSPENDVSAFATSAPVAGSAISNLEMQYRLLLCDILGIDRSLVHHFSLRHLRMYARPYNRDFGQDAWYCDEFAEGEYGLGLMIYRHYSPMAHFAQDIPELAPIGQARGDLDENDVVIPESSNWNGFGTGGNLLHNQALGVALNPFGLYGYGPQNQPLHRNSM